MADGERPLSMGRRTVTSVKNRHASVLLPQAMTEFEAVNIPPPPPLEARPRNASDDNLEREEDAKLEAIAQRLKDIHADLDDIPPPPPPPPAAEDEAPVIKRDLKARLCVCCSSGMAAGHASGSFLRAAPF